jgi:hypothetical protein
MYFPLPMNLHQRIVDVPSNCELNAVESSRGTAELAPVTELAEISGTWKMMNPIPERAGGV